MNKADKIHFNLDQFSFGRFNEFAKNPGFRPDNITNWELHTILKDKRLLDKTIFYEVGGRARPAPVLP